MIFTPGQVWLLIVTVFSSCHTQIYINITQLPLPGLYIMTFVFVFRYSLTKLGNLSFPHRCIPIVKQNTITWLFSPDQQSMEHHNIVVQRDSIICCLFPPKSASSQYWLNLGAGVPLWHWWNTFCVVHIPPSTPFYSQTPLRVLYAL